MIRHVLAVPGSPDLIWHRGRVCDLCIDGRLRDNPNTSYEREGWHAGHPQAHSETIGKCVDAMLLAFLESFNVHVAPTFASCEGDPPHGDAYLAVSFQHFDVVWEWLQRSGDRYEIDRVTVNGDRYGSVRIGFWVPPDSWRG